MHLTENQRSPDFPESASLEFIDNYGNHCMITWWPVTYYRFEHRILGETKSDVPLPDTRDRGPKEMPKTFKWVLEHLKKAREVIGSTVPEIKEKKEKDDGNGKRKRKRKRKARGK